MRYILLISLVFLAACGPGPERPATVYQGLQSNDPNVRIESILKAGNTKDDIAVPLLVDRLSDTNTDVRFYAGIALKKITGHDLGWKSYAPPLKREEAIARWRSWLEKERPTDRFATSRPTTQPKAGGS